MFGDKVNKKAILKKCEKFSKKGSFPYRVCKLLKDGDFSNVASSQELAHLLNEGAGKKIKVNSLTALMEPLLHEDMVKVKIIGKGRNKRKFWIPGWLDKKKIESDLPRGLGANQAMFFTGANAWSDPNKNFPKIISLLKGDLDIVDPFYGHGTFYVLEKFGKKRKIRFLTCTLGSDEQRNLSKFTIDLKRFKKEFKNIDMRKYPKPYELHDRYIVGDNALVVVGHGLKDLANKESFVIYMPSDLVKDFLPNLRKIFNLRWKKSSSIR